MIEFKRFQRCADCVQIIRWVCELEKSVRAGRKVEEKEFVVLTELLMVQPLKLDGIEAEGKARAQRKAEVHSLAVTFQTLLVWQRSFCKTIVLQNLNILMCGQIL
ncbi:hypothetical protein VPH35_110080 [Triticum aestivum]|uniref:BAG domain-containing protein n=1 Tax=Triticum turgidum subsp. durum TaxID=4567 RepID=A0A9R1B8W9_TRITD|nr:unnamed protein product [Triticum turgidum subsp. durum]